MGCEVGANVEIVGELSAHPRLVAVTGLDSQRRK